MIGFERRLRWRQHKLFKLRAKPPQCEKRIVSRGLSVLPRSRRGSFAPKICDSPNSCASHNNWAEPPAISETHNPLFLSVATKAHGNTESGSVSDEASLAHRLHRLIASQRRLRFAGLLKPSLAETSGTSSGRLTRKPDAVVAMPSRTWHPRPGFRSDRSENGMGNDTAIQVPKQNYFPGRSRCGAIGASHFATKQRDF
jgi:hypothetical protein